MSASYSVPLRRNSSSGTDSSWMVANCSSATLSVIIPTHNRIETLMLVLMALEKQAGSAVRFDVIVVVDGAIDGTVDALAASSFSIPLTVIVQDHAGPAARVITVRAGPSRTTSSFLMMTLYQGQPWWKRMPRLMGRRKAIAPYLDPCKRRRMPASAHG